MLNTPAFWPIRKLRKNIRCCEYAPWELNYATLTHVISTNIIPDYNLLRAITTLAYSAKNHTWQWKKFYNICSLIIIYNIVVIVIIVIIVIIDNIVIIVLF